MRKSNKYLNWLCRRLRKQEKTMLSTSMAKESPVSYQQASPQDIPSAYTLHRSIRTLPYDNFLHIITGSDLGQLIITGQPPVDELVTAWEAISDEYSNALRSDKSKGVFAAYKKIVRLQAKTKLVDACLYYLTELYDEEIATILHENGYRLITFTEDHQAYLKQIDWVRTQAKTLVIMLNQAVAHYKLLAPANEMNVERNYQNYIEELAILGKHQGYALRAKEITVLEYCSVVNAYIAYVEANKKQQK